MKKVAILFTILVLCIPIVTFAELPDISLPTWDEMVDLQAKLTQAIWASDKWQEVTVPLGVYTIGVDIPAGRWTIKGAGSSKSTIWYQDGLFSEYAYITDDIHINLTLNEGD